MHVCLTGFSGESEAAQLRQLVPRTSEVQALHRLVLFLRLLPSLPTLWLTGCALACEDFFYTHARAASYRHRGAVTNTTDLP